MKTKIGYNSANSVLFFALSLIVIHLLLGGYQLLIAYSMDFLLFIALAYAGSTLDRGRRKENLTGSMLRSLQHINILLTKSRLPISTALLRAAAISRSKKLSLVLLEIRGRMLLGQDFAQAVKASKMPDAVIRGVMSKIATAYSSNFDTALAVKDAHSSLFHEYLERMEKFYSSVQKYTSLSMVTGTIAPSFALFAIIGYSITNSAHTSAFFPVLLFVVVLPFAFSALRLLYVDPYAK